MNCKRGLAIPLIILSACGCASLPSLPIPVPEGALKATDNKPNEEKKKTLLEWTLGKKDDENRKEKEKGNSGRHGENGKENATADDKAAGENGKDDANSADAYKATDGQRRRIDPDRPHLPEASSTVGLDRAVLEAGYTYNTSGGFFPLHSFPEALLGVGMFAEWFELRISQNLQSLATVDQFGRPATVIGANDWSLASS
jgi:hypothetical protein